MVFPFSQREMSYEANTARSFSSINMVGEESDGAEILEILIFFSLKFESIQISV